MANTFKLISSVTVGAGGSSSIDFTNIPQTYTDLYLWFSGRTSSTTEGYPFLRFNSDSGNNYSNRLVSSYASSSSNSGVSTLDLYAIPGTSYTSNVFGAITTYIPNYTSSIYKSVSTECNVLNSGGGYIAVLGGRWAQTSAITSISIMLNSSNTIAQHSVASLYGIKKN